MPQVALMMQLRAGQSPHRLAQWIAATQWRAGRRFAGRVGGQKLVVDPKTESFTNCPEANALIKREYRKPWVVPEEV